MLALLDLFPRIFVFRKFSESEQKILLQMVNRRILGKGDYISFNGDLLPYVTIVGKGVITISKESPEGRILNMRTLSAGNVIWGHALFDGQPTYGSIKVSAPSVIYQWNGKDILPILKKNNEALWELSLVLHQRMRQASATIERLAFSCVSSRLAQLLLDNFKPEQNTIARRLLTLDKIASEICTTKEVVCRLLRRFSNQKLISLNRKQIVLVNKTKLEEIANGNEAVLFDK